MAAGLRVVRGLGALVDRLGALKAEIADLESQAEALKAKLVESGEEVVEGSSFRVAVSRSLRVNVDWKAVAAKLEPSPQLVSAHTSEKEVVSVRVSAR